MRNLTQVSALPVCEDEDAALRACSNGLVGELFRIAATAGVSMLMLHVSQGSDLHLSQETMRSGRGLRKHAISRAESIS